MSTSRTFHPFRRLPANFRGMIYRHSSKDVLIKLTGASRLIRQEVLDYLYGRMVLVGSTELVQHKLSKLLAAPNTTDRLRPIPSATRILSIWIQGVHTTSWMRIGLDYQAPPPHNLASHMVSVLDDTDSLQVLTLDVVSLDPENLRKLERFATYNILPKTLKSLRLHGNDSFIIAIMKGLYKNQLQSLALRGLSSYSLLGTLIDRQQKILEFDLCLTTQSTVLLDFFDACLAPAFLQAESLSINARVNHDVLIDHLRDRLKRLKYLSVVDRGLPSDAVVARLTGLYFSKLENLKYLVIKFDYPAAIMAERVSGTDIRTETVHELEQITWPIMSRVTGEYPRYWVARA